MRRKVLQEFVNSFCQRVVDLPDGHDLASFAYYGTGTYDANILTGECSCNGKAIPSLRLCDIYRTWMEKQLDRFHIDGGGILTATLEVQIRLEDVSLQKPYATRFASAHFYFDLHSKITTDEKTYLGKLQGDKVWGFDWYYERLYGELPEAWPPVPAF